MPLFCFCCCRQLGDDWSVKPELIDDLEKFTCLVYGKGREKSVNAVRAIMLKQMVGEDEALNLTSKVDLSRLPPCRDNLIPHINSPSPFDCNQGWEKTSENRMLEPIWSCGPILPLSLVDMVEKQIEEVEESKNEDIEIDYEDMFSDDE